MFKDGIQELVIEWTQVSSLDGSPPSRVVHRQRIILFALSIRDVVSPLWSHAEGQIPLVGRGPMELARLLHRDGGMGICVPMFLSADLKEIHCADMRSLITGTVRST